MTTFLSSFVSDPSSFLIFSSFLFSVSRQSKRGSAGDKSMGSRELNRRHRRSGNCTHTAVVIVILLMILRIAGWIGGGLSGTGLQVWVIGLNGCGNLVICWFGVWVGFRN